MEFDFTTLLGLLEEIRSFFFFLYKQFVGSETQDPYSESYIWMANQFGHFFLGFGGMFFLTWIVSIILKKPAPSHGYGAQMADPAAGQTLATGLIWLLALFWFSLWMLKEWFFDYLLLSQDSSRLVTPFTKDLVLDSATDSFFYIAGIILALAHFGRLRISPIPVLFILAIVAFFFSWYWIPAREKIQTAGTPYFIRLNGPDLGIDVRLDTPDPDVFLSKIARSDRAFSRGLMSAIREEMDYPLQYMMETPLKQRQHVLAVANSKTINRLGMALTNERVVRQNVREDCNSRYITFRDLMESEVRNTGTRLKPVWKIETRKSSSGTAGGGEPEPFIDRACPLEATEFLVVDQVPSVEIATAIVTGLVMFPDTGWQEKQIRASVEPEFLNASPTMAERVVSLAKTIQIEGQSNMDIFLESLKGRTVIWVLDSASIADGWSRLLLAHYSFQEIRIMDPTESP